MTGVIWKSQESKQGEWNFAKKELMEEGKLKPEGTILSRENYPDTLEHTFIVTHSKIIALGGKMPPLSEDDGSLLLFAEDEEGNLFSFEPDLDSTRKKATNIPVEYGVVDASLDDLTQTLTRFQLLDFQLTVTQASAEQQLEFIQILNSSEVSALVLDLYNKINKLDLKDAINPFIKEFFIGHLIHTKKNQALKNTILTRIKEFPEIKKSIFEIIEQINTYRHSLQDKASILVKTYQHQIQTMSIEFKNRSSLEQIQNEKKVLLNYLDVLSQKEELQSALKTLKKKSEHKIAIENTIRIQKKEIEKKAEEASNSYYDAEVVIRSYIKQIQNLPTKFSIPTTLDKINKESVKFQQNLLKLTENKPDLKEALTILMIENLPSSIIQSIKNKKNKIHDATKRIMSKVNEAESLFNTYLHQLETLPIDFSAAETLSWLEKVQREQQLLEQLESLEEPHELPEALALLENKNREEIEQAYSAKRNQIQTTAREREEQVALILQQRLLEEQKRKAEAQTLIQSYVDQIQNFSFTFTIPTGITLISIELQDYLTQLEAIKQNKPELDQALELLELNAPFDSPVEKAMDAKMQTLRETAKTLREKVIAAEMLFNDYIEKVTNFPIKFSNPKNITALDTLTKEEHDNQARLNKHCAIKDKTALNQACDLIGKDKNAIYNLINEQNKIILSLSNELRSKVIFILEEKKIQEKEIQTDLEDKQAEFIKKIDEFEFTFTTPTTINTVRAQRREWVKAVRNITADSSDSIKKAINSKIKTINHASQEMENKLQLADDLINKHLNRIKKFQVNFSDLKTLNDIKKIQEEKQHHLTQLNAVTADPKALESAFALCNTLQAALNHAKEVKRNIIYATAIKLEEQYKLKLRSEEGQKCQESQGPLPYLNNFQNLKDDPGNDLNQYIELDNKPSNNAHSASRFKKNLYSKDTNNKKIAKLRMYHEEYNITIDSLLEKINEFKNSEDISKLKAATVAHSLYDKLRQQGDILFAKCKITRTDLKKFQKQTQSDIKNAEPELAKHRGFGLILAHIAAFIGTGGIGYLAALLIDYLVHNRCTFFENQSSKKLRVIEKYVDEELPSNIIGLSG